MKKILITGASGFIGSFIVASALERGMEVWAGVRGTSSRRYLQDSRIHFLELDFSSEDKLRQQLSGHTFDYIVHAAGATKCTRRSDFFRINTDGTRNFVNAILGLQMPVVKFVYMSSLSVFGAIHEQQPYVDITDGDTPQPNTAYGKSKLAAEHFLESVSTSLPWVILRPTGVYGPREKDYYVMMKSIRDHVDFAAGFKRQDITFIYVKDLVEAVFLALEKGPAGRKYFLSDGKVYQSRTFSDLVHESLGRPWWIRITAPLWILRLVTLVGELRMQLTGHLTVLNSDKYNILSQRNWRCDITPARRELGFTPQYDLRRGVEESVEWYKENKWL